MIIPTLREYTWWPGRSFYDKPINLDITNKCPLQCPACVRQSVFYEQNRHLYKEMSIEDFQKILDTFSYIEFCGQQSDPLAHKHFIKFVKMAYSHKLDIHTASSHRKEPFYEEAYEVSGFDTTWIFGLDGLPEESHKYRINQDGVHLYEMMKLGANKGCNIVWQYIIFNYNQDHIEQARQMASDEGMEFKLSKSSRWETKPSKPRKGLPNQGDTMRLYKPRDEFCA